MLPSAKLAIDAVDRWHRACPTCKGSGKVEPSELFSLMSGIAYGSSPKLVMCLDCFGEGVKQP